MMDRKLFSKIRKKGRAAAKDSKPVGIDKITALRICIALKLSLEETQDMLSRADLVFSPCDKVDLVVQFAYERGFWSVMEIDRLLDSCHLPTLANYS